MGFELEVCCYSVQDVQLAKKAGATRVELCADFTAGGTTPSYGLTDYICSTVDIEVVAMIRPRAGDFVYDDQELEVMRRDIEAAARAGAGGVALGLLRPDGKLDAFRLQSLVELAKRLGLEVTFHRAFDLIRSPKQALDRLIDLGVDRVLTSGQRPSALEGVRLIEDLLAIADGKTTIMAGGGVRVHAVPGLWEAGVRAFHTGAMRPTPSRMEVAEGAVQIAKADDGSENLRVDYDAVAEIARLLTTMTK